MTASHSDAHAASFPLPPRIESNAITRLLVRGKDLGLAASDSCTRTRLSISASSARRICTRELYSRRTAHCPDGCAIAHKKLYFTLEPKVSLHHSARSNHDSRRITLAPMKEVKETAGFFVDQNAALDVGVAPYVNIASDGFDATADVRTLQQDAAVHIADSTAYVGALA